MYKHTKESNTMTKAMLHAEPEQATFSLSRTFNAPRERVFATMMKPESIPQWWGKRDHVTTVDQMEVRMGGIWRYVERDQQGNEYAFHGVYHSITPPERIIDTFEFEGMPGHVILETMTLVEDAEGKTTLTVASTFQTVADRDGMLASGMEEGANETYDRLEELLASL
jgi:uncharacterized protein YndB with AHSA1/START domain